MYQHHEKYMRRCLDLAKLGQGKVSPNPMVGAVIVVNDKIIGEGYHQEFGGPHAEVHAVNSVKDQSLLKTATIYVSLEPCSHHGKTPPCVDLIIEKKIPRVVIAEIDSNAIVCGNGIAKLKQNGIEVVTGILEKESNTLNKAFNTFHSKQRPFVTLKWAQTADGFIDHKRESSATKALKISNSKASRWVHKLRSEMDAILVGKNTAILDNPSLTTRLWYGKNPTKVVIDKNLELQGDLKIFDNTSPLIVFNQLKSEIVGHIEYIKIDPFTDILPVILNKLWQHGVQSLLVEGGTITLQKFIDDSLFDEVISISSNTRISKGIKAPTLSINPSKSYFIDDNLIRFYE